MRHAAQSNAVPAAAAVEHVADTRPCGLQVHAGGGHDVGRRLGYGVRVVSVELSAEAEQRSWLQDNGQFCRVRLLVMRSDFIEADARWPTQRQDGDVGLEQRAIGMRLDAAA